ncbi:TGRM1 protein, partial [Syrrhaptes paradoxus]|nr:TGRM1 protein [Syrrhaptes paradoxus]
SPNLTPSQGVPVIDELFFSRKKSPRSLFQNSVDLTSERSSVCAGVMGSHQPQISGKCGTLGHTQTHGKSSSVDSDLQFLGLNNCHQDKACAGLNFSQKTQRSFCNQAEHTVSFQGPSASQGNFILPSYPLSSPRSSPKHVSSPADSPKKSQENSMNFSSSRPLQSFEGPSKPSSQKQLLSQKSGDDTGRNAPSLMQFQVCILSGFKQWAANLQWQLPKSRLNLQGVGFLPCQGAGPLSDSVQMVLCSYWFYSNLLISTQTKCPWNMQNSLRSLRNSAAKKKAKLSGGISDLESPDSALKLDLSAESPSHASSPSAGSCSESGVYSPESLTSPVATVPQRRRRIIKHVSKGKVDDLHCVIFFFFFFQGLPESLSSFPRSNSVDSISPSVLSEDAVVIVGKGVLGGPPSAPTCGQSTACVANGGDHAVSEETEPSSGICGTSIQQNSASHLHVENEKGIKVTMSKSAQDKIRRKKKEEKEQNHKEYQEAKDLQEKEENSWESFKLNELEKVRRESEDWCLCYRDPTPSVAHGPETMAPWELQLLAKPEAALTEALTLLAGGDWEKKIQGLNFIRRLSANHATILAAKLHETSLAVAEEVKNLRSGVSRAAVVCLGDLFTYLKKSMDQELDNTVKVLLHKAGESNTFIREEVDKALKAMVNNVTPARALCSLINGGQSHLVGKDPKDQSNRYPSPAKTLKTADVMRIPRLPPAAVPARAAGRGAQGTYKANVCLWMQMSWCVPRRYYGRKMLFSMMTHPHFDSTLEKYVPAKDLPYLKESVSNLREKGLGDVPLDAPSAKGKRSHTRTVGHSESSSASRGA